MMSAYSELVAFLHDGELVEAIVFGPWGGYGYGDPGFVPRELQGRRLSCSEAKPHMIGWRFQGDFGGADCHPAYIWTDQRVIWVAEYDGATNLVSAPRNPADVLPELSGG